MVMTAEPDEPQETSSCFAIFNDVQKSYDGETLVVKGFNLEVQRGEFVTLLGPSGSGKTTCLMMMAGFETPTHGEILLDGTPINNLPPHKRGIGMVFQNYALFPHMSVAENLAFPLEVRGMTKEEINDKVANALDMVRLGDFGDRRPGQLSGGQQQRVALARALVFEPELVLMDEPLGALDKNLREEMQFEIKRIHQHLGITMLYVTHDQTEALTMSDRIAVFNDGIVQQLATPEALYEAPKNAFVAYFIGENNRLNGQVSLLDAQDEHCTVTLDSGEQVRALKVAVNEVGERTQLSLRPERVRLLSAETAGAAGTTSPPDNIFSAEVLEVIYLGDHLRTRVAVCGSDEFIIKTPNAEGYPPLRPGQTLSVGWDACDCRALDA